MKKKNAFHFFNLSTSVKEWSEYYKKINLNLVYPAEVKRLEIFLNLLNKYKPKKIIDAGCGAGMPLIKIKKMGFNISGYDRAPDMLKEAKKNLKKFNINEDIVQYGNFENPTHLKNNSVDCILGMGAFYYAKNFNKTLKNQIKKLKKNGRIIFSLRNQLFDIATFNDYSFNFFSNFYNLKKFNNNIKNKYLNLFKGYNKRKNLKFKNIDDNNIFSKTHNPLTIERELMDKIGLKTNGIYFYHFHALPPFFEEVEKVKFRKESLKMEDPKDWRGYFIASGFIVDCQKI